MIIEQWDKRKINSKTFAVPILTASIQGRLENLGGPGQSLEVGPFSVMNDAGLAMSYCSYCAKHNQHAKARGVWGHAPQEIFENLVL